MIIRDYWGSERQLSEYNYSTLPFPFDELETPLFGNERRWTLEQLIGYLNTLPAVRNFIEAHGTNPVNDLYPKIKPLWGTTELRRIHFPMFLRMGLHLRL